jgi:tRNA U34 5-methylaminomethyl-2-thiouridine-forming methyltransferase MnmC
MNNEKIVTSDGSPTLFSKEFGCAYRSVHGAVAECQHVYINTGMLHQAEMRSEMNVLEIGFGTGLVTFMTFLETEFRDIQVNYTAYEGYPITLAEAESLQYPELLTALDNTKDFAFLHTSDWNMEHKISEKFSFKKKLKQFENLNELDTFDVIYFDPFAPNANPYLWSDVYMTKLFNSMRYNGVLTTYCAQGEAKRAMKRAGFMIEALPGANGKREMTRATKI